MSNLSKMLSIAAKAHENQFDKGGKPYFLHCLAVMNILNSDDEDLNCIAIGHDLIEDTPIDFTYLRNAGFSTRVCVGIFDLTKREDLDYDDYKEQVFANIDAMRVKKADLTHNSDIRRLKGLTEKDFLRIKNYHTFYMEIIERLKYDH
jgi:(p)ppGpp synthase/HD superfamily hydrolase